ncbi:MAG: hypothetical protein WB392_07615 [Methanotrichaceae archaeon]
MNQQASSALIIQGAMPINIDAHMAGETSFGRISRWFPSPIYV